MLRHVIRFVGRGLRDIPHQLEQPYHVALRALVVNYPSPTSVNVQEKGQPIDHDDKRVGHHGPCLPNFGMALVPRTHMVAGHARTTDNLVAPHGRFGIEGAVEKRVTQVA